MIPHSTGGPEYVIPAWATTYRFVGAGEGEDKGEDKGEGEGEGKCKGEDGEGESEGKCKGEDKDEEGEGKGKGEDEGEDKDEDEGENLTRIALPIIGIQLSRYAPAQRIPDYTRRYCQYHVTPQRGRAQCISDISDPVH